MSYPLSDEDSTDSESGIRFKTESTRNKSNNISLKADGFSAGKRKSADDRYYNSRRSADSSRSDRRHHRDRSKNRNERHKRSRTRSRERRRSKSNKSDRNVDKRADSSEVSKREKEHSKKHESDYVKNKPDNKQINNSNKHKKEDSTKQNIIEINSELTSESLIKNKSVVIEAKIEKNTEISFGSVLPLKSDIKIQNSEESSDEIDSHGPTLPPKVTQTLKNNINNKDDNNISEPNTLKVDKLPEIITNDDKTSEDPSLFGPALPPHLQKQQTVTSNQESQNNTPERTIIGPSIPSHLREKLQNADPTDLLIPHVSDSDDDMIGPVPEGHATTNISHKLLEERALEMKINSLNPTDSQATVREEWMMQLPGVHIPNLGLGPRQFRSKAGPDLSDRSSWTDTPQDKEKKKVKEPEKVDIKEQSKIEHIAKRDIEQAEMVSKHKKKKKRDKALIDLHREKLKKKEESSSKSTERRPFDRDIDLKTNRFDDAQKKAILKKAQLLDTRFSCGESKFL